MKGEVAEVVYNDFENAAILPNGEIVVGFVWHSIYRQKTVGGPPAKNTRTLKFTIAPTHCPFCGKPLNNNNAQENSVQQDRIGS